MRRPVLTGPECARGQEQRESAAAASSVRDARLRAATMQRRTWMMVGKALSFRPTLGGDNDGVLGLRG